MILNGEASGSELPLFYVLVKFIHVFIPQVFELSSNCCVPDTVLGARDTSERNLPSGGTLWWDSHHEHNRNGKQSECSMVGSVLEEKGKGTGYEHFCGWGGDALRR